MQRRLQEQDTTTGRQGTLSKQATSVSIAERNVGTVLSEGLAHARNCLSIRASDATYVHRDQGNPQPRARKSSVNDPGQLAHPVQPLDARQTGHQQQPLRQRSIHHPLSFSTRTQLVSRNRKESIA